MEVKPLVVFVTDTKMVKEAQEPKGNCWVKEGLLSKYRSPGRGLLQC